jgi:hypothetical protein
MIHLLAYICFRGKLFESSETYLNELFHCRGGEAEISSFIYLFHMNLLWWLVLSISSLAQRMCQIPNVKGLLYAIKAQGMPKLRRLFSSGA